MGTRSVPIEGCGDACVSTCRYKSSPMEGGVGAECLHRGVWGNEVSPLRKRIQRIHPRPIVILRRGLNRIRKKPWNDLIS